MMLEKQRFLSISFVAAAFALLSCVSAQEMPKPPKEPAKVAISVAPETAAPGGAVDVVLTLSPKKGIKINQYPKIKLTVPAQDGLVAAAEASVGNDAPPAADDLDSNYFKKVTPLKLTLPVDEGAAAGEHEASGKLRYFYCVTASGFCAPAKVDVKIPIRVSRN